MLSGLALIGAGVFAADPGGGYPAGGPAAASPSVHGVLHDVAYYGNLTAMLIGLVILARRFSTESGWRGWSAAAMAAAGLMVTFVATYAVLAAQGGPAGVFDRLALLTPYVFGVVLVVRLIAARDARVAGQDRFVAVAEAE
jgi:peptidoglycan/LPS O-acetylase OafA/YrhL